jgi:hypothetical protein
MVRAEHRLPIQLDEPVRYTKDRRKIPACDVCITMEPTEVFEARIRQWEEVTPATPYRFLIQSSQQEGLGGL